MYEKLQYISQASAKLTHIQAIEKACKSGVRWIQLRVKNEPLPTIREWALEAKEICAKYGAVFIVNDHVDIALEVDADGVHVGKEDMSVAQAREILGAEKVIGGTANTFDRVKSHWKAGADYVGLGPFRFTSTKEKLDPVLGVKGYFDIAQQCKASGIQIPIYAIGGIKAEDVPVIIETGLYGIAISGAITHSMVTTNTVNEIKRGFMKKI